MYEVPDKVKDMLTRVDTALSEWDAKYAIAVNDGRYFYAYLENFSKKDKIRLIKMLVDDVQ